jgi:type I restriction enzyme S subunit
MAVSQHFVAWICGPELLPEYLLNVIRGPMQDHFGSLTAGATIATIGMPDLNQLVLPVPPLGEQKRIVEEIADIEDFARRTIEIVTRQIALLQERRQSLITAVVTGQLDIPEAA